MMFLTVAVILFGITHVLPAFPGVKSVVKAELGKAFGPLYGITSLVLLVAMIWAFRLAERPELYDPPSWGRHANFALTLIGFLFAGIFLFRGSWRNAIKYPMALAVLFWGAGHLLANGDWASVIFISGLMIAALLHAALLAANRPFAASEVRGGHNLLSLLAGLALYAVIAQLHGVIIGMPVFSLS